MKRITLLLFLMLSIGAYAQKETTQKGINQFSVFAGYEHFPELRKGDGYNIGIEFKHYLNNRFFALANFHAGVNDAVVHESYSTNGVDYNFDLGCIFATTL